jgi:hypothetical protein
VLSFVFYFHSRRTENLRQSLRLLSRREESIGEVVLVCNDSTDEEFEGCRLYNMGLKNYEKPRMCNFGVSKAKFEVVALLDSDRVLPAGHFGRVESMIGPGKLFSCGRILCLDTSYSDDDIESGRFGYEVEEKSRGWEVRRKNLFSGNTTFMKADYLSAGGMDERFVGYGFADNDMTYNVLHRGMEAVWVEGDELHLHHERETMESGEMVGFDRYRETSQRNLCRFLRKWGMRDHGDYRRKTIL